jgi:hypothetical protein
LVNLLHARLAGVVLVAVAAGLAGCSGAAPANPGSGASVPGVTASGATAGSTTGASAAAGSGTAYAIRIDRPIAHTLNVASATQAHFSSSPVALHLRAGSPGETVAILGVDAQGQSVAVQSSTNPMNADSDQIVKPSQVGIWNGKKFVAVATSGRETKGTLAGQDRQITNVASQGDRLVWMETPTTEPAYFEWSLRTASLDGSGVRELAHSKILTGGRRYIADTGGQAPVMVGDWVYWATAVPTTDTPSETKKADWEFDILRTRLSRASKVETVERNAVMPVAAGGSLAYAAYDGNSSGTYVIHLKNVSGDGSDRVLASGVRSGSSFLTGLAASGSTIAWTVSSPDLQKDGWVPGKTKPGQIFVMNTSTGSVTSVVTQDETEGSGTLAFTRTGIVWGNGSANGDPTEYYLNTTDDHLFKLGKQTGFSVVYANPLTNLVQWAAGSDKTGDIEWREGNLAD